MLKLLKIILNTGQATTAYPFKPLAVSPGFRGKPELNPQQCIACGSCTAACPANALTMETHPDSNERIWQLYLGRCIYCGRCEEVCPTRAIHLTEEFELAVTAKQDLYTRAVFRLQRCRGCQQPFTVEKSLAFALDLLAQSGTTAAAIAAMRPQFETCPACRRQEAIRCHDRQNSHYSPEAAPHEPARIER